MSGDSVLLRGSIQVSTRLGSPFENSGVTELSSGSMYASLSSLRVNCMNSAQSLESGAAGVKVAVASQMRLLHLQRQRSSPLYSHSVNLQNCYVDFFIIHQASTGEIEILRLSKKHDLSKNKDFLTPGARLNAQPLFLGVGAGVGGA